MATGISLWDLDTGDHLLHIPTSASPSHGLLCLKNQFLVASQIHRHGSVGVGAIFIWPLNKPQAPLRSYTMEAIGPISCTRDGVYLAGGALSGNAYFWEVANGKLLKTWRAHHKSLNCMLFSDDGSLLISGSDDGVICVWSLVSLLDVEDESGSSPSLLYCLSEHNASITSLLTTSGSSNSMLISSSMDGTCRVSDLVLGRVIQTNIYPVAIMAIVLHPSEKLLFCGSQDGRIFMNKFDIGLVNNPLYIAEEDKVVLKGHKGSITALTFSQSGMISASEDGTIFIWDVISGTIIRRFNHQKGPVTNLAVIPQASLFSVSSHRKAFNAFRVSLLDKYPQQSNSFNERITLLSSGCSPRENQNSIPFQSTDNSYQQIHDLEKSWTPAAMQMKVETSVEKRMWATKMAKHVMEMNKHLQSRLLDLMQSRLLWSTEIDSSTPKKRKKLMAVESAPLQE
ncbi:hypothetical protein FEM48_Zijuj05G0052500 [Ziziphus jujuba var. spinosa]|uniref:Protein ROOT INITIATION DEFECTIVE 3-like n=1 Tax=Ziziphus jujuba var. spinosa TaxID=714518 RepID=A0A978VD10_ZIZJJ|nr:hypothetical protein FEM48_Zijuj05G0052500 [Ziziphus jujuba var. spinosa]